MLNGRCWFATTVLVVLLLAPVVATAQERGYTARACGFDMNRNGIVGEPEDCNVCDGTTTDPDGDGKAEDLLYIDANAGSDTEGNGTPQNPYRTIQPAGNVADGPGDGAEDILCFRGTATTEQYITPGVAGVAGTYTVPKSGSQARDWLYPRNPTMLVGWDSDDDGAYPPFDPDDKAVLDGTGDGAENGLERVFALNAGNDYLEIAHLEMHNYGRYSPGALSGFVVHGPRGDGLDYVYYHDLELYGINMERLNDGGRKFAISLFSSGLHWTNFTNLLFEDDGGWFVRGSGPDSGPDEGPIRWQNITRTAHGCDFSVCGADSGWPGFKVWGYISGLEILDSVWDGNVDNWQPDPNGGHGTPFLVTGQCSQDWTVRNNEIIDASLVLNVQPTSDGFCDDANARPVDRVVFDRNIARNTYPKWGAGNIGIQFSRSKLKDGEGDVAGETIGSVTITNNFLSTTGAPWEACVWVFAGNDAAPPPGEVVVANNTCVGEIRRRGAISIGAVDKGRHYEFMQHNLVIKNNVVVGVGEGERNVQATYAPANLEMDANVFDPAGTFQWVESVEIDLAGWRQRSGADQTSRSCLPSFVDSAEGDFHLQATDACARGYGQDLSSILSVDIDGEPRPAGQKWEIGADQLPPLFADGFESGDTSAWSEGFKDAYGPLVLSLPKVPRVSERLARNTRRADP